MVDAAVAGELLPDLAVVAPLEQLDVVVTDEEPLRELKVALEAAGVRIVVA